MAKRGAPWPKVENAPTRQAAGRSEGLKRVHSPGMWYSEWDLTTPPIPDPAGYLAVATWSNGLTLRYGGEIRLHRPSSPDGA